jgi:hypothetical protein
MHKDDYEEIINNDIEVIEEFINIDESLVALEQNKALVRMEMNIIEFPLFSKSNLIKMNQIKKYYFSSDKKSFLEVIPAVGTSIPGEFEERVFIALLKIFKKSKYSPTFYCKASEILDNMNVSNEKSKKALYSKVKQSISKLTTTTFKFKNLFYSNALQDVIDDLIETNILTYRLLSFKEASSDEKEYFSDKRVKEIYKISVSSHFYDNIIKKGYLVFDADELLNIKDSITRSIYTMITKWRNNKLYLKRPAFYIARRVPLAWTKHSIKKTVPRIEKSLIELKELNYISDYILHKNGKLEKAEFEIFFSEDRNKIQRDIFYDEKADFNKIVHYEELTLIEEVDNIKEVMLILEIFGEKGKKLKSLPNTVKEALKKYDFNYVMYSAEYTNINCKVSILKYFKEALLNNWAEEYIARKEIKEEKKTKKIEKLPIEEAIIIDPQKKVESTALWDEFLSLPQPVQEEITATAYEEYLLETGTTDTKLMKGIFEKGKKAYILKTMEKYHSQELEGAKEAIEKIEIREVAEDTLKTPKEPQVSSKKINKNSNEIIGEYISVTKFLFEVSDIVLKKGIPFSIEKVAPIFKVFMEFEDEFIRILYDESTKEGVINIK